MDADGYPEEHELERICTWPCTTPHQATALMDYIRERWTYPAYWKESQLLYRVSTGGWGGNEELIVAARSNPMFSRFIVLILRSGVFVIHLGASDDTRVRDLIEAIFAAIDFAMEPPGASTETESAS